MTAYLAGTQSVHCVRAQGLRCKQLLRSLKEDSPLSLHVGTEKDEARADSGLKGESVGKVRSSTHQEGQAVCG